MEEILLSFFGVGEKECLKLKNILEKKYPQKKDFNEEFIRKALKSPEIFDSLKKDTQTDLIYNPLRKIPRKLIKIVDKELSKTKFRYNIAGSYRRGKDFSGDVDLVLNKEDADFDKLIKKTNLDILEPFAKGEFYIRTLIFVKGFYLKLDVFLTSTQEYGACLLYCTGSQNFNIIMRSKAKKMNLKLDQHGLWDNQKKLDLLSEKDFFDYLQMDYLEPFQRNL